MNENIKAASADFSTDQENNNEDGKIVKHSNRNNNKYRHWITVNPYSGDDLKGTPEVLQGYVRIKRQWPKLGHNANFFYLRMGLLYHTKTLFNMTKSQEFEVYKLNKATISYSNLKQKIIIDTMKYTLHLKFEVTEASKKWLNALIEHQKYDIKNDFNPAEDVKYDITTTLVKDFQDTSVNKQVEHIEQEQNRIERIELENAAATKEIKPLTRSDLKNAIYAMQDRILELEKLNVKLFADKIVLKKPTAPPDEDEEEAPHGVCDDSTSEISQEAIRIPETDYEYKMAHIETCRSFKKELERVTCIVDSYPFGKDANLESQSSCSEQELTIEEEGKPTLYNPKPLTEEQIAEKRALVAKRRDFHDHRVILLSERPNIPQSDVYKVYQKLIMRDLSYLKLPIKLYEPLSVLQRLCEELDYSSLLDKAAEQTDPVLKMVYVLAFSLTTYLPEQRKFYLRPFTPLPLETYECIRPDRKWKFVAEQVSIDPPISAAITIHNEWTLEQEFRYVTKYQGVGLETVPYGGYKLTFNGTNEVYRWSKVGQYTNVKKEEPMRTFEGLFGIQEIVCAETNLVGSLNFKTSPKIKGWVQSRNLIDVEADSTYFGIKRKKGAYTTIWTPNIVKNYLEAYYDFSEFTVSLNEEVKMKEVVDGNIPCTDSRLRPDIRHVELGDLFVAEKMHQSMRDAQKKIALLLKENKNEGFWFKKRSEEAHEDHLNFHYNNEYWDTKEKCNFKHVGIPNIFDLDLKSEN